jgi:D-serine deaminase-like pyridoxal phosphate-dependent protein
MAKQYAPAALVELARLAKKAESEQARVGAIKEILDRAYGKSTQPVSGDPDNPLIPAKITIELIQP